MRQAIDILLLLLMLTCVGMSCAAQDPDTVAYSILVDSISIMTTSGNGQSLSSANQSLAGLSLTQQMDRQSSMTVRSGGPALISTVLRRGMASRHLAVLWNGFNIQSAVNGTYDLGLLPRTFTDVKLLSHEKSTIIGNASSAGALILQSKAGSISPSILAINYGSDENADLMAKYEYRTEKQGHSVGIDLRRHQNNYRYKSGGQKATQELARFDVGNITYDGQYHLLPQLHIKTGIWLQKADRQIPPSKTSANPMQSQSDENYRIFTALQYQVSTNLYSVVRSAYSKEKIHFVGPGIDSRAAVDVVDMAWDMIAAKGLTTSLQYRSDGVDASFFSNEPARHAIAGVIGYGRSIGSLDVESSIRAQIVDRKWQPAIYHLRAQFEVGNHLSVSAHHGKGYTLPALNDLYWPVGGDPDLKPETSYLNDITVDLTNNKHDLKVSLYHNTIDNWIQWIPVAGVFQPVNQRIVRNMGLDLSLQTALVKKDNFSLSSFASYGYLNGRLLRHYTDPELEGKRTIFVPAHKAVFSVDIKSNSWDAVVTGRYYGQRFDAVDNSSSVDRYAVLDATVSKSIPIGGCRFVASCSIENLLNSDYEHIRFYPMPLRLVRLGISFAFN